MPVQAVDTTQSTTEAAPGSILDVRDLVLRLHTRSGVITPVNGVSFAVQSGRVLTIIGESGSGKTLTALAIMGVAPRIGKIAGGSVLFQGQDLFHLKEKELQRIRGREIAITFQDATASLNPLLTIGSQVAEMLTVHLHVKQREARALAEQALRNVGISDAALILDRYAYQISGGMRQRALLAMATVLHPKLLIADEPTSGQDVTLQAEILDQLRAEKKQRGTAIVLITHDLSVAASMADDVAVMYAGYVVERGPARVVLSRPVHPYTFALLRSMPGEGQSAVAAAPIRGNPPDLLTLTGECPFIARCNKARSVCRQQPMPPLKEVAPGHAVACYNPVRHDWA